MELPSARLIASERGLSRIGLPQPQPTDNTMNIRTRKFTATLSLFATAGLLAVTGYSQTPAPTTGTETPQVLEKFEVTGSYLPVSAGVNASPVVTIQNSDIGQSGATDALRLLRQVTPFFSGSGNAGTEANN